MKDKRQSVWHTETKVSLMFQLKRSEMLVASGRVVKQQPSNNLQFSTTKLAVFQTAGLLSTDADEPVNLISVHPA